MLSPRAFAAIVQSGRAVFLGILLLFGGGSTASGQGPATDAGKNLVGTWQMVSRVDRDASDRVLPETSLGSDPVGYLIYDASGHVAVQLMARQRPGTPCEVTAIAVANNLAQVSGYEAYFGRYEVDAVVGTVTHIIEGALSQADVGRRLTRRFSVAGDRLTIQFEPGGSTGDRRTRTVVWQRVSR